MEEITITQALSRRRTTREFDDAPISLEALENLIWSAQGITDAEGKRTAPSAHAIHPLRLFVVASRVRGLGEGMYEVNPVNLSLKKVGRPDLLPALRKTAIGEPQWITDAAVVVIICADMLTPTRDFLEQKPYGARGGRYVYLEAGAAAQNLQLQAVAEHLGSVCVGGFDDGATADVISLEPPLAPIVLLCVGYPILKG